MKIQLPRFEVKIIQRNNVQRRVGSFDQHERAVAYGEKFYAGRYVVIDRRPEPDLTVQNEGSIFLLRALTDAGRDWIDAHIPDDAQHFGGAVVVEHRYIADIVQGAVNDGLEVQ